MWSKLMRRWLRLGGPRRSGKPARPARFAPSLLALEGRDVPAVFALFTPAAGGVLSVFGDAADNTISVSRDAAGKILVSGGASPAIRDALGPEWGYRAVGLFVGGLIALGAWGAWRGTRTAPALHEAPAEVSFGDQLRVVRSDRPFRLLLTTFVVQALATGAMLAGVDYVSRWILGTPLSATLLFVCFVAPALLVTPLWQRYGMRFGKKRGYLIASLFLAAVTDAPILEAIVDRQEARS